MASVLFDVFAGSCDQDASWIESAHDLADARERMEEIAEDLPGQYFVFSRRSQSILDRVDTRETILNS